MWLWNETIRFLNKKNKRFKFKSKEKIKKILLIFRHLFKQYSLHNLEGETILPLSETANRKIFKLLLLNKSEILLNHLQQGQIHSKCKKKMQKK